MSNIIIKQTQAITSLVDFSVQKNILEPKERVAELTLDGG